MSKPKKSPVVSEELKVVRMPKPRRKRKRYSPTLELFPGFESRPPKRFFEE